MEMPRTRAREMEETRSRPGGVRAPVRRGPEAEVVPTAGRVWAVDLRQRRVAPARMKWRRHRWGKRAAAAGGGGGGEKERRRAAVRELLVAAVRRSIVACRVERGAAGAGGSEVGGRGSSARGDVDNDIRCPVSAQQPRSEPGRRSSSRHPAVNGARYGDHVVTGADDENEGSVDALHHSIFW